MSAAAPSLSHAELLLLALAIADAAVVDDIASHAWSERLANVDWCDVSPMLDEREISTATIDLNRCAIDYALARGLVVRHPVHAHLVRIARRTGCPS